MEENASRPRRQSSTKQKKMELLEKMRSSMLSGKKNKYDIGEMDNVYEEVDEREYSKKVLQRQEDDWIVDDGGCGYVEDGREIFDDDLDEESIKQSKKSNSNSRKRPRSGLKDLEGPKGNIRNMIATMPSKKKKESQVKLEDDDILEGIIGELDMKPQGTSSTPKSLPKPIEKIAAREYVKSFASAKYNKPKVPVESKDESSVPHVTNIFKSDSPVKHSEKFELVKIKEEPVELEVEHEFQEVNTSPIKAKEDPCKPKEFKTSDVHMNDEFESYDFGSMDFEAPVPENVASAKTEIKIEMKSPEEKPQRTLATMEDMEDDNAALWVKAEEGIKMENVNVDKSKLPLIKSESGDEVLQFFCWDVHEEMYTQPGTVFLFGKVWIESVKSYISCCVIVKNIDRQIFLLPREKRMDLKTGELSRDPIAMKDVYEEFNTVVSTKYKIEEYRSKTATKKYAFGKEGVPLESEYLEVHYSANKPALPQDLVGETFSHVFGTNTSFLELLILNKGIKGPCWIEISNPIPSANTLSWCKVEVICSKVNQLKVLKAGIPTEMPPLTMLVLRPQPLYNPKTKHSEIVAVSCLVNTSYPADKKQKSDKPFTNHFCVLSRPSDVPWPYDLKQELQKFKKTHVQKMESERALLNFLLTKLYKIDPDIIVGHELSGHGIGLILERLTVNKIPNWSRFGRLRRVTIPHMKSKQQIERIALTGRLLCDIKISAKELLPKCRNYELDTLCQYVLHFKEGKRPELTDDEMKYAYSMSTSLINAVWVLMCNAADIIRIVGELNILPLALQITNIAGNILSRTLLGGRAERNEFLLLHAFHNKGFITPDKEYSKNIKTEFEGNENVAPKKGSRKKPAYSGGLVLDPKVGFYKDDLILLMDFNSLYPSIIQEYNVCFTTIPITSLPSEADFTDQIDQFLPDETAEPGILPIEIRKLVESRREIKKLLKSQGLSDELRLQYDIRQMALKLTANSMYGCLGFTHSRFRAKALASMITGKGREILMNTKKMVENFGYDVVYGDTDSLMINTKTKELDEVYQVGRKIKSEVNKCYKQVEFEVDGVFKFMLLLKKKKYAAITLTKLPNGEVVAKEEMKGLDIVRRDWSQLASETGRFVLSQILCDQTHDDRIESIHNHLGKIRGDLETDQVPLSLLTVTKQLTKPPEEYNDPKALPHVQVALRINSTSSRRLKQGDTVSYIICEDGTDNPPTQRAYHVDELKANKALKIDVHYYLSQQIHPVISRICEPIEGTDGVSIARCLGLDPGLYVKRTVMNEELDENGESIFGRIEADRFKNCSRFVFKCRNENCGAENVIDGPIRKSETDELVLEKCSNPECKLRPMDYLTSIQNKLQLEMRVHMQKYAQGWLLCEDPVCNYRTRQVGPIFEGAYPVCLQCDNNVMRREVSNLQLYNQLCFYSYMFDLGKVSNKPNKFESETYSAYKQVFDQVGEVLKLNKYSVVDLSKLFYDIFPPHKTN